MSVSVSLQGPRVEFDLKAILEGGPQLQARIAAFKAAMDDAEKRIADAEAAESKAAETVNAAKTEAAAIVADARAEGERIIGEAVARRERFDADLAAFKREMLDQFEESA